MQITEAQLVGVPMVDIVVPTHNRLDLTMKCLQAIYFHTQSPFHIIVVDDSTDNLTPRYFEELFKNGVSPLGKVSNITFIHNEEPFKTGNQFFNLAFRYAKSDYIATVMNSIRVEPEWEIFALNSLMVNNPTVGIIGFKCLFGGDGTNMGHIESAGIKMNKYLPTDIGRDLPGHRLNNVYECDAVQWAFALLRKKAVVGVIEDFTFHGFAGWDDIDNCFVVKSKGWKIIYSGSGVGYHEPRSTRGSSDNQVLLKNRENGEKFYKRWGLWDDFVKDHGAQAEIHELPKETKGDFDMVTRTNFSPLREEVPA